MPTIKRYSNRKLYNPDTKQYITLQGIAELVREGEEKVYVIDNKTGEDLTAITFSQIVIEQERLKSGSIPIGVLALLIKMGSSSNDSVVQNILSSITGVENEIERRIQLLIEDGEVSNKMGKKLLEKMLVFGMSSENVEQESEDDTLPSAADIATLNKNIEALLNKLD